MDCKIIVYSTNSANKKRATLISDFDSFFEMIRKSCRGQIGVQCLKPLLPYRLKLPIQMVKRIQAILYGLFNIVYMTNSKTSQIDISPEKWL